MSPTLRSAGKASAVLLVLGLGWGARWLLGSAASPDPDAVTAARNGIAAALESDPQPPDPLVPARALEPAPEAGGDAAAAGAGDEPADAGWVTFTAVDADGREPLENTTVRLLGGQRFAAAEGAGEFHIPLSAGTYQASVHAAGYEPAALGPFEVVAATGTDLGTVALARGCGGIRGRVYAPHLDADETLTVELWGRGRRPCDGVPGTEEGCGGDDTDPCPLCGYAMERSAWAVHSEETFEFTGLAAGDFFVHLESPDRVRIDPFRPVRLARGETAWIEVILEPQFELWLQLQDEFGQPFDGTWLQGDEVHTGTTRAFLSRAGELVATETITMQAGEYQILVAGAARYDQILTTGAARYKLQDVVRLGATRLTSTLNISEVLSSGSLEIRFGDGEPADPPPRSDRDRDPGDSLELPPLDLPVASLRSNHEGEGRVRLYPLPRGEFVLQVLCGPCASDPVPVTVGPGLRSPVVIVMRDQGCALAQQCMHLSSGEGAGTVVHETPEGRCLDCHR